MKNEEFLQHLDESIGAGGSLFGGAPGGGAGTFSYTQIAGAKTWAPQPRTNKSTSTDPQGFNVKDIGDDEHMFHHQAPRKRPYPLETIHDFLVNAYIQLANAESQVSTCLKQNAIMSTDMEKKAELSQILDKIKSVEGIVKEISLQLDGVTFT